mgnify:CR=1 FL=1
MKLRITTIIALMLHLGCAESDPNDADGDAPTARDPSTRLVLDMGVGRDASGTLITADATPGNMDIDRGDPDCRELYYCLTQCTESVCSQACRTASTPDGSALYDAIYMCAAANECTQRGGGYIEECMDMHCTDAIEACIGPPAPPPPPPMGTTSCSELDGCLRQCSNGDLNCRDRCVEAASPMAFETLVELRTCDDEAPCSPADVACILRECEAEYIDCYGSIARPVGSATCDELNSCLSQCTNGEQACANICYRMSSEPAYNAFQGILRCIQSSGCPDGDGQCHQRVCEAQFETCFGAATPQPMGTMSCRELNTCLQACPDGDELCLNNCIGRSTQMAYDAFLTAVNCMRDANQCAEDDAECRRMACEMEIEGCLGARAVPMGTQTCGQLNDCLAGCAAGGDANCSDACIRNASPDALRRLENVLECIEASGCPDQDGACYQNRCGPEIQACVG